MTYDDARAPRSVAIAHDYLTQRGGAERVVLAMARAFPDATIYTTLYDPEGTYPEFRDLRIVTSPLNRIGPLRRNHRAAFPFLALAARGLRIQEDVVICSSSGWAHGVRASGKRIVYCYSPARWLYQSEAYLGGSPWRTNAGRALLLMRPWLRRWDRAQAARADVYLANSNVVADRIRATYDRPGEVLHSPHSVDIDAPQAPLPELADWADAGYHLLVSRLLPYKNVDVAVRAFADLDERLVVIGRGPHASTLRDMAGPNVRMIEGLTDAQMRWAYAHATALVAPSLEDFGLTPLEAGAFGKPTLALRGGGYLDTVVEGVTGAFFDAPTPELVRAAVVDNRGRAWDTSAIEARSASFAEEPFARRLQELARTV